jgi:CRP/FNR family transcriptional regulator
VKAGVICLYRLLRNGRRQIVGFKLPGEFIGLGHDAVHRCSAEAIGAADVRCFQTSIFHTAAADDTRFLRKLYESVASDLTRTHEHALSVGQRDAEGSIAAFVLSVERRVLGADSGEVLALPMSRADIADYLSLSVETVSRVLTGFKRQRLIDLSGRRGLKVRDHMALRALAEGFELARRKPGTPQRLN